MTLVIRLGAAMGVVALAACSQSAPDNAAENMDANAMTANEAVMPVEDNATGADTLGNQMNMLNESGNAADTSNTAGNDTANTTNTY